MVTLFVFYGDMMTLKTLMTMMITTMMMMTIAMSMTAIPMMRKVDEAAAEGGFLLSVGAPSSPS